MLGTGKGQRGRTRGICLGPGQFPTQGQCPRQAPEQVSKQVSDADLGSGFRRKHVRDRRPRGLDRCRDLARILALALRELGTSAAAAAEELRRRLDQLARGEPAAGAGPGSRRRPRAGLSSHRPRDRSSSPAKLGCFLRSRSRRSSSCFCPAPSHGGREEARLPRALRPPVPELRDSSSPSWSPAPLRAACSSSLRSLLDFLLQAEGHESPALPAAP